MLNFSSKGNFVILETPQQEPNSLIYTKFSTKVPQNSSSKLRLISEYQKPVGLKSTTCCIQFSACCIETSPAMTSLLKSKSLSVLLVKFWLHSFPRKFLKIFVKLTMRICRIGFFRSPSQMYNDKLKLTIVRFFKFE